MTTVPTDDRYAGRPVLVTGGAGFIGSHLVHALVASGAEVRIIDDLSTGLESNLEGIRDRVQLEIGSIRDRGPLRDMTRGVDVVFHQAAMTSVPGSVDDPAPYVEANTLGTFEILEAARDAGVRRVVFAASSSAYGDQPVSPKVETMFPDTLSPYAATKGAGEQMVRAWSNCYDLDGVSLHYFNIFGPRQRPDSPYAAVIPLFADAMLSGRTPMVHGDGEQTRDFTHVANAVHANLLAGAAEHALDGAVLNVACGVSTSLLELIEVMADVLGVDGSYDTAPPRVGDVKHSRADIERTRELLGYESIMSYEDGLRDALGWYRTVAS